MATAIATHRILLIDDHPAVSAGVERLLSDEADFEIVGVATAAGAARRLAAALSPTAAVVDMHLPGASGLVLVHDLVHQGLTRSAVVYTAFLDDLVALGALIAGANAAVSKGVLGADLVDAVRAAARGHVEIPRVSAAARIEAATRLDADDLPILGMLMHAVPADEIADVLQMTGEQLAARRRAMVTQLLPLAARAL
jgi:DNA-binding NarL/FixJ family response regulator